MPVADDKLRERVRELEIKEKWFLHMLNTVCDCQKCKFFTQCKGAEDCQKTMQRAADRHAYKVMYES